MRPMFILLLLLTSCIPGRNYMPQQEVDADSLVAFMKTNVRPYLLNWQSAEPKKILDSLHPLVLKVDHYSATCYWLNFKSTQNVIDGHLDSANYYISEAMRLALQYDTSKKILLSVQIQFANVLKEQKLYDSALHYARDAYGLALKTDTTQLPIICYRLYEIYRTINDLSAMRKYLFEGFHLSTRPEFKTVFANGIADYYDRMNETDSAIAFFETVERDTSFASPYIESVKYENLGALLRKKKKYGEALNYQLRAMEINKEIKQLTGWPFLTLAFTYSDLERYAEATIYFDSARNIAAEEKDLSLITQTWKGKAEMYAKLHQYQNAYSTMDSAFRHYQLEVDSSIAVAAKELETKYAVKSKDDEIHALAITNKANEKIRAQQRILIFALIITMIALSGVVFLLWKRKQLRSQLQEAELQQQLLRSRMEPHFIFNTLAVLQSFIRKEYREKSLKYLSSFSKLLRLNLENSRQGLVPLKEEVEALRHYLDLQAANLENRFEYFIDVENDLSRESVVIPPMLIQPFVENAVIHGVSKVDYKGIINIKIEKQNSSIHCIIDDNGAGLKTTPQNTSKKSSSTQIIRQRLAILARHKKQSATLTIVNKQAINEGHGVKVILNIGVDGIGIGKI